MLFTSQFTSCLVQYKAHNSSRVPHWAAIAAIAGVSSERQCAAEAEKLRNARHLLCELRADVVLHRPARACAFPAFPLRCIASRGSLLRHKLQPLAPIRLAPFLSLLSQHVQSKLAEPFVAIQGYTKYLTYKVLVSRSSSRPTRHLTGTGKQARTRVAVLAHRLQLQAPLLQLLFPLLARHCFLSR